MNYQHIYNCLMQKAITRNWSKKTAPTYVEKHHIIPKSLNGTNDACNLTYVTAKEHYVAHHLLYKMQIKDTRQFYKMAHAFSKMCVGHKRKEFISSGMYQRCVDAQRGLDANTIVVSDKNTGKSLGRIAVSEYHKNKDKYITARTGQLAVVEVSTGIKKSILVDEYHKNKDKYITARTNTVCVHDNGVNTVISNDEYHKNKDKYTHINTNTVAVIEKSSGARMRISSVDFYANQDKYDSSNKGKVNCTEIKTKKKVCVSVNDYRNNRDKYYKPLNPAKKKTCPHCGLEGRGGNMIRYHFDNCKKAP